ncbi:hypothetical protein ACFP2F_05175 [Hymenobacter artigasi]|uniref:Uncharacterized protein n=1 Tax=Hymenobacter artigasi TaxID=2719616 RepID=A0ABX1HFK0_9BACT|nr:hypothetical protein [Hymenobacter artigasi]NKI89004.1 hypothetical protein [Hymenobacter artigasi]
MKKPYLPVLAFTLLGLGTAQTANAQYAFTDINLAPYSQNFDTMSGTVRLTAAGSLRLSSLAGVYAAVQADAQFGSQSASPDSLVANDGSTVTGNYYHFGAAGSSDRAFGGIAESGTYTGTGFVGIRLRNDASVTIHHLEVQYAMEQWYNSGNAAAAYVNVAYRKSSGVAGENMAQLSNGAVGDAWTAVAALTVEAPSTGTTIQNRDGNAASNRRVAQTILTGLDLAPGQEIMLRWDYVLNPTTNGNGVSIDDVLITPQTSVSIGQGGTNLRWTNAPATPGAPNQTYYLAGTVNAADLAAIDGANAKIIVGTPALNGQPAQPATLVLSDNTALNVPVEVAAGSMLRIEEGAAAAPLTLALLAPTSTVVYAGTSSPQTIRPASYGRLRLEGAGAKNLGGNILAQGNLELAGARLTLGSFDATVAKGAAVVGASASAYVVTDRAGRLRQSVLSDNAAVVFPVGTSAAYLPLTLRQSATRSEDVFAVRASDARYAGYDATDAGIGTPLAVAKSVKNTWLVSEEVKGNANVTMQAQWTTAAQSADFDPAQAYISHYHNSFWDRTATEVGATLVPATTDTYTLARSGIRSFSPFTVSADAAQPLPVELKDFAVKRGPNAVYAAWATASERNSQRFILERSLNGEQFIEVGTLPAAGISTSTLNYTLTDNQLPAYAPTLYYRLRQVDADGSFS